MGWRVSFYKADKEKPVIITQAVDDGETYNDITINGEQIMYDQATDVWCELSHDNEELFIALAGLRDDTPINSYYWFNDRLIKCEKLEPKNLSFNTMRYLLKCRCVDDSMICFCVDECDLRKATVNEIIEHFKK